MSAIIITLLIAYAAAAALYASAPWRRRGGWWVLAAAAAVLGALTIANYHLFTVGSGASAEAPYLANYDAWRNLLLANELLGQPHDYLFNAKDYGYPLLLAGITVTTGHVLAVALALNVFATLVTIVLTGGITRRLCGRGSVWGMAIAASICYLVASGCVMIKDALVIAATAAIVYAATTLTADAHATRRPWLTYGGAIVAIVVLGLLRNQLLIPLCAGVALLAAWRQAPKRQWALLLTLACIAVVVAFYYAVQYVDATRVTHVNWGLDFDAGTFKAEDDSAARGWITQLPLRLAAMPLWQRLLYMPLCAAIQFLLPLPWNMAARLHMGYSQIYAHFSWPWYALGGLLIYYYAMCWWRSPRALKVTTALGLAIWLMPVWLFAGTVSRYALPTLPLLIPGAVYVLQHARWHRLRLWLTIYAVAMLIALGSTYYFINYGL